MPVREQSMQPESQLMQIADTLNSLRPALGFRK